MSNLPVTLAFLPQLGMMEMMVVMGIAVMLFGKRLPEVGRSLGRGIVEFKKGLNGITDELDLSSLGTSSSSSSSYRHHDEPSYGTSSGHYGEGSVPKFEPPTSAPVPHMEYDPNAAPQD
ncbi:MAG: twin-arginine translocase TatA/TatE family subunit [Isosphaeraceae bacterium]